MKSRKLMGIFALASCVMLAGCGKEEPKPHEHSFPETWKTSETQHWHECECGAKSGEANHIDANSDHKCDVCGFDLPIPAPAIELKELPELIVEGETIELKDYVKTVDGGAFDLNFDDDSFAMVDVDGTKITFLAEGEVSFEASYKGEKVNGTFNVMSLIRSKFLEWTTDVGYTYETWCDVYNDDYTEVIGIERDMVHNDEYVHMTYFDYDEALDKTYSGGYAKIDGHYYSYITDDDETEAVANPGYVSSDDFETFNCPLELNDEIFEVKNLKKEIGFNTDGLILKEEYKDYAYEICAGIAGITALRDTKGNIYIPVDAAFFFDTLVDSETGEEQECMFFVPFVAVEGHPESEGYYDIYYVSTDEHPLIEDSTPHVECVEYMIENKVKPAPYDFSAVTAAINDIVDTDNYTVAYNYGWFDSENAPLDPEDYPSMEGLVFQDCEDSFVAGQETVAVTNEACSMYSEEAGDYKESRGYLLDNETVYNYAKYETGYQAVETDYESISDVGDERFAFLSTKDGFNDIIPEDLIYAYSEESKAYSLNIDAQNKLLSKLFKASSTLSDIVTKALDPYLIDYDRDLYSFFEGTIAVADDGSVRIEWDLVWDEDAIFKVAVDLCNQGTTTVPSDIIEGVKAAIAK